jgi:hypothetical protein
MLQERFEVLRAELEKPSTDPAHEYRKGFIAGQIDMRDRPEEQPEQPERTDGMPASADERYLRRLLAVRVGIPGAYYDDGEAHGAQHGISIDFMREPVAELDAKLRALNMARAEVAQPAGVNLFDPKGEHA